MQIKKKGSQKAQIVGGLMLPIIEAVLHIRTKLLGSVQRQVSYATILKQASQPLPSNTFKFTAEQIVSLVTNVVIQIAQPQLCTKTLPEKQVQTKSYLSKQIAETAKKCLGVNIEGKDVFESIIHGQLSLSLRPLFSASLWFRKRKPH